MSAPGTNIQQLLSKNVYAGLVASVSSPGSGNAYATLADITGSTVTEIGDPVISELATPPGTPTLGDRYLIIATATGAWAGHENEVAEYNGSSWDFTVPVTDNILEITSTGGFKRYNGTSWVAYGSFAALHGGNTVGSNLSIGTKNNKLVYVRVNNTHVVRFGNGNSGFTHPIYAGNLLNSAQAQIHITRTSGYVFRADGVAAAIMMTIHSDGTFTLGEGASAFDDTSVAIGKGATVSVTDSVAIGSGATVSTTNRGVAIGPGATMLGQGVAIGYGANGNADRGVAIGYTATSTGTGIAIGGTYGSSTTAASIGIAIGEGAQAGAGAIVLGFGASSSVNPSIAIGQVCSVTVSSGQAYGYRVQSTAAEAITFGRSVDNATFLTNNVANSFGIGWSEATPSILIAKTADSYFNISGGLAIGSASKDASAILDLVSTTKAFYPPRLTGPEATTLEATTPNDGATIYVTSTDGTFSAIGTWCKENGTWTKL